MQAHSEAVVAALNAAIVALKSDSNAAEHAALLALAEALENDYHHVWVVLGQASTIRDNPDAIEYRFDTQAELEAFGLGLDVSEGYPEVNYFDTKQEADEHIKSVVGLDDGAD